MANFEALKDIYPEEVAWLKEFTAYEQELEPITGFGEAATMIWEWQQQGIDDIPELFTEEGGSDWLKILWNVFVTPII